MPPMRLTQPSKAISKLFSINFAPRLTKNATAKNTSIKDINGNHLADTFISFMLVFLVVAFLINLGAKLIEKSFEMALLGWVNRIGGILLFIILYTIIFSIFLFYAEKIHLLGEATIRSSVTFPYIKPWGPKVIDGFGKIIPVFKDMFIQLETYFESLSTKIRH